MGFSLPVVGVGLFRETLGNWQKLFSTCQTVFCLLPAFLVSTFFFFLLSAQESSRASWRRPRISAVCARLSGPAGTGWGGPAGVGCFPRAVPPRSTPPVSVRPHTRVAHALERRHCSQGSLSRTQSNQRGACERRECLLAAVRHASPRYPCAPHFSHRRSALGGRRRAASRCACVVITPAFAEVDAGAGHGRRCSFLLRPAGQERNARANWDFGVLTACSRVTA